MILTIDGADRTGKNTIHRYIAELSNHKYVITDRGILTQIVYSYKYQRGYDYDLDLYKNNIIIYLTADERDLEIRSKITNEPEFDIKKDLQLFNDFKNFLISKGFIVLQYNTSVMTPYQIAMAVVTELSNKDYEQIIRRKMYE